MDTGNKAFVQFNENSHNCVRICNIFTWIGNKIKKKKPRCVMKHKCLRKRQIPEVAIIVKTQGQDFKIYGSNIKVLSQVNSIWNTKALSLTIQKIWPKWKFLKSGSNFKVKVTRSKIMVPLESSCHKEHTYEIWNPYHLPFKIYGQCKFWKVGQTSRSRSQGQTFWYQ
jgi:hypothetical protein